MKSRTLFIISLTPIYSSLHDANRIALSLLSPKMFQI